MKQVQQCVCSGALQAAWLNAYLLVTFKYTMPTSKPHKVALMPKKDAPDRVIKKVSKADSCCLPSLNEICKHINKVPNKAKPAKIWVMFLGKAKNKATTVVAHTPAIK